MSPWKGRNLPPEKDALNYYLSLNWQVIEPAFGILVQYRVILCPLQMSVDNIGGVVQAASKLLNICIDGFGTSKKA
jgi:hypothetical protein